MRAWARSRAEFTCGRCAERIPAGEPVFLIQPIGLSHAKRRCHKCADDPMPAVIPEEGGMSTNRSQSKQPIGRMSRLTAGELAKVIPFDYKQAQSGTD